jgi:hypothetical protein
MKNVRWMGWLLAGLLLVENAAVGQAAAAAANPLEGHLLQASDGSWYVYHGGMKFSVQVADLGDAVIQAIPSASADQWEDWFTRTLPGAPRVAPQSSPAGEQAPTLPSQPAPFPGYS